MKLQVMNTLIALVVFSACNNDRIEQNIFVSPDEYLEEMRPEVQEFEILNEDGNTPIVGNRGTELYVHSSIFEDSVNRNVVPPYKIQLVELYKHKDFILYKMGSQYPGGLLNYKGALWTMAYKGEEPLSVKTGRFYRATLQSNVSEPNATVYFGGRPLEDFTAWQLASNGSSVEVDTKYNMNLAALGWNMAANFQDFPLSVDINFEMEAEGTEFIQLYAVVPSSGAIIKGENMVISNVPKDEDVSLIAFAFDEDGEVHFFRRGLTVQSVMTIDLEFEQISQDRFLVQLEGLD